MSNRIIRKMTLLFFIALALVWPAQADDIAQAGRQVVAKWQNAVVTVQLVVKTRISYGGEEETDESKVETAGAVIDPSGLVVVSLTRTSPSEMFDAMDAEGMEGVTVKSDVTDVKIRLADGKEVPAKIVLRDRDLDLAFIRPLKKPGKPMEALNLAASSTPGLLDQLLVVYRLGVIAGRTINVGLDRVEAIMEKPRTFYIPGVTVMSAELGSPVFSMDGGVVGLLLLRTMPGKAASSDDNTSMPMILPAADILEAAKQAPADAEK